MEKPRLILGDDSGSVTEEDTLNISVVRERNFGRHIVESGDPKLEQKQTMKNTEPVWEALT